MLTKMEKRNQADALKDVFEDVHTVFLLENHGLKVNDVTELRRQVREANGVYKVVKNSVVRLAIQGTDKEGLTEHLFGPKVLAYTGEDSVELAKVIKAFIKTHPELSFHEAYLEGDVLQPEMAEKVADLPTRDELIAKLLYLLQSPMRRLAVALNSPIQKLASVLHQIAEKQES